MITRRKLRGTIIFCQSLAFVSNVDAFVHSTLLPHDLRKRSSYFYPRRPISELYEQDKKDDKQNKSAPWDNLNPYKAGKLFRDFIEEKTRKEDKRVYYLDERFIDYDDGAPLFASESLPSLSDEDSSVVPEVLVVGATGLLGRIVVRKLLIEGYRVRVLVRDLYSSTLNLLGTKVIYCKGDLYSYDSLEFAVTDVDKIVYCAADEVDEKSKRNIDSTGLTNLVQSFLNTRVADYGMSQSAKRTLFKFGRDFNLFDLESSEEKSTALPLAPSFSSNYEGLGKDSGFHDIDSDEYIDDYADVYEKVDPDVNTSLEGNTLSASWILNDNNRAVFHGRIPTFDGRYRTTVISEKLQSRNKDFLDFRQAGFAGLILRVVGDGKVYEAIIRTSDGTEYSSPFQTATKPQKNAALAAASGASRIPKFVTIRLPFSSFKNTASDKSEANMFDGSCVQYFGIRFRTSMNPNLQKSYQPKKFYLALAYVKLYRRPFLKGPEFIYFSDAAIPPQVSPDMVRHDVNQIIALSGDDPSSSSEYELFNEKKEKQTESSSIERGRRLGNTETYFKYIGEQVLKSSGLNYAIFRVSGYNNAPGSDGASMIELSQEDDEEEYSSKDDERLQLVSRADVAELCVSSLSSPSACNVFCYVRNRTRRKYRKSGAPKNIPLNEKISKLKADI